MTKDQEDTRDWMEKVLKFIDPGARLDQISDNGMLTLRASFTTRSTQYVQIRPSGKPAWDGERAASK